MKFGDLVKIIIFCLPVIFFSSCKTHFEKIRTSNDAALILKEADKFYEAEEYAKAQSLYELIIPSFRGRSEAESIFYKFAYTHYNQKQFILAAHYFKNYADTYYNSPFREETAFMSSYSNYRLSPSYKLDQSYSLKAIEGFQLFTNNYPNSDRVEECNKLIDEIRQKLETKAYEQGKLYYQLSQYDSSIRSFENMLKDFPETKRAEEIRYIIAKSSYEFAINSVFIKKEERFLTTISKCETFFRKFPNSSYFKEINNFYKNSKSEINKYKNG